MKISEVMNGAWRDRSIYVCEERAIPSVIDGLKPSQRFLLTQGYKSAKTKFDKVISIAGSISALGFHHGNASAEGALTAMGAYHSNNLPIFLGDGNFGNVLAPEAAAPRYIFARLQPWIDKLFLDNDLCPKHDDPEISIPKYYLPIIPMVLVNGIRGIATGYACNIPAHDPIHIIDLLIARAKNKPFKKPRIKLPHFTGEIIDKCPQYILYGKFTLKGSTKVHITEIPWGYTMESYEAVLDKLVDQNKIVSYDNDSRLDRFDFKVTLKRGTYTDESIIKLLKLSTSITENLTTVTEEGRLKEWDSVIDILEYFYDFRLKFIDIRIKKELERLKKEILFQKAFIKFCTDVINKKFDFKISDDEFRNILISSYGAPSGTETKIMNSPARSFTTSSIRNSSAILEKLEERYEYVKNTTPEKEYIKDLTELKKAIS